MSVRTAAVVVTAVYWLVLAPLAYGLLAVFAVRAAHQVWPQVVPPVGYWECVLAAFIAQLVRGVRDLARHRKGGGS